MASAFGSVWVADIARERLLRLDPRTRAIEARIPLGGEAWVGAAAGSVWALGSDRLLRIDPSTNRVVASIPTGGQAGVVLEGRGVVWLGNPPALRRVDLQRNAITSRPISPEGSGPRRRAPTGGSSTSCAATNTCSLRRAHRQAPLGRPRDRGRRTPRHQRHRDRRRQDRHVGGRHRHRTRAVDARPRRAAINNGTLDGTTLWVHASDRRDRLWRLDARTGHVTGSLMLPEFGASGLVAPGGQVWTMSTGGDLQVALGKG